MLKEATRLSGEGQETRREKEDISSKIKTYTCRYCGDGPFTLPELGTHSKTCPERLKALAETKKEGKEGEVPPPESVEARQIVAQFGREGLNKLKRERLRAVLGMAPGVGKKAVPWIMHNWDVNARVRDDPMEFWRMLHDEIGLKPNTATSIVKNVFSLEEEFADLLYQRGERPVFFSPPGYGYRAPSAFGWGYGRPQPQMILRQPLVQPPTQHSPGAPFGWPSQPFYSAEDLRKAREEAQREERLKKVEEASASISKNVGDLMEKLPGMISDAIPQPERGYVEERIPLDSKGKPTTPDKAVSLKVTRKPITEEGKTMLRQFTELKEAGLILTPKEAMDMMEDMMEKRKPAIESIEEHPTFKSLKEGLEKTEERYNELKETMEAEDRKRIEGTIKELRDELKALRSRPAGQYSEDTFRLLDSTLNRLADILEGRKPMEAAKELLLPPGVSSTKPPSEKAGAEERSGVLQQLAREGLVVKVLERRR